MHITPRQFRWVCLALAIAALGLRLPGLAERSINIDEITTGRVARNLRWETIGGRPPLSFALIAVSLKIRDSQTMLLLPAVLFGAAAVGFLAWAGRVAFGWRVGLMASLWLLFSAPHIGYSQYARYYSFMILFSIWSYMYLELWLRMRRWRYLAYWLPVAACNMLSHFFAAFVVGLQIAIVLVVLIWRLAYVLMKRRGPWAIALTALVIAAVAAVGWAGFTFTGLGEMISSQLGRGSGRETYGVDLSWAFWRSYAVELTRWPEVLVPAALALLAFGAVTAWSRSKVFLVHLLGLIVGPVLIVYYTQPDHPFEWKYVSFALPFVLLGLSPGPVRIWELAARNPRIPALNRPAAAAVLGCVVVAVPLLGFDPWANEPMKRGYRDITRYMKRLSRPGEQVYFAHPLDEMEFTYFAESENLALKPLCYKSWKGVRDGVYATRLRLPFWCVAGRLYRHDLKEMEWLLNAFSRRAFENGYAFFPSKHVEMELPDPVLESVRIGQPDEGLTPFAEAAEVFRFSVFIPRSGEYCVLSNQTVRQGMIRFDDMRPTRWIQLLPQPVSEHSKVWIAEGRHDVTMVWRQGELARMGDFRLRCLPVVSRGLEVAATQFDFIWAYDRYDTPKTQNGAFGFSQRRWARLSYLFLIEDTGEYKISVTADNDRPTTNEIGLLVNDREVGVLQFDRRDNSLETKDVRTRLKPGICMLTLHNRYYRGALENQRGPIPDGRKMTFVSWVEIRPVKPDANDRR